MRICKQEIAMGVYGMGGYSTLGFAPAPDPIPAGGDGGSTSGSNPSGVDGNTGGSLALGTTVTPIGVPAPPQPTYSPPPAPSPLTPAPSIPTPLNPTLVITALVDDDDEEGDEGDDGDDGD